ncbi:MAG TPA: hypothetical protein VJZ27_01325, partial [Aggregatilineales bacterium]|nr:hypothetical protein [Aggregatilineales bacterium]
MSDKAPTPEGMPEFLTPFANFWIRTSPRLVPLFAVISAFLLGIPLMIISAGDWSVARGLDISITAYSALIEGATGLAINQIATESVFDPFREYAAGNTLEATGISRQGRPFNNVATIGVEHLQTFKDFLNDYPAVADMDEETFIDFAERIKNIRDNDSIDELRDAAET